MQNDTLVQETPSAYRKTARQQLCNELWHDTGCAPLAETRHSTRRVAYCRRTALIAAIVANLTVIIFADLAEPASFHHCVA